MSVEREARVPERREVSTKSWESACSSKFSSEKKSLEAPRKGFR